MLLYLVALVAPAAAADPRAPSTFQVTFVTDVPGRGTISLNITRSDAPLGVDRFYALVKDSFFHESAFFRVVPDFVVQFGIAGEPKENIKWQLPIVDDPVVGTNTVGTITFATSGPDTRTTELFINTKDNARLDKMGFAPFGIVTQGMDVAKKIFDPTPGNSNGIDQNQYMNKGNSWLKSKYPKANFITTTHITNVEW